MPVRRAGSGMLHCGRKPYIKMTARGCQRQIGRASVSGSLTAPAPASARSGVEEETVAAHDLDHIRASRTRAQAVRRTDESDGDEKRRYDVDKGVENLGRRLPAAFDSSAAHRSAQGSSHEAAGEGRWRRLCGRWQRWRCRARDDGRAAAFGWNLDTHGRHCHPYADGTVSSWGCWNDLTVKAPENILRERHIIAARQGPFQPLFLEVAVHLAADIRCGVHVQIKLDLPTHSVVSFRRTNGARDADRLQLRRQERPARADASTVTADVEGVGGAQLAEQTHMVGRGAALLYEPCLQRRHSNGRTRAELLNSQSHRRCKRMLLVRRCSGPWSNGTQTNPLGGLRAHGQVAERLRHGICSRGDGIIR
jgi:hypothetical protein